MPKGQGRQDRAEPSTEFGRRLEAEFVSLGYVSMADRERACSGFCPTLYPAKIPTAQIRQWMRGSEPRLGAVKVLEAIGVDVHFCLTGHRSNTITMHPCDGFDVAAFAAKVEAAFPGARFPIRWSAPETLATVRFRDRAAKPRGSSDADLFATFAEVMRTRASAAGSNPIESTLPQSVGDDMWLSPADLATLARWFELWIRDFGIRYEAPPLRELLPYSPELRAAVAKVGAEAVRSVCDEAWHDRKARLLANAARGIASKPTVSQRAA